MTFTTTIKRKYWNMKMEDADNCTDRERRLFMEYKEMTEFWNKRLRTSIPEDPTQAGVFLVGREVHRVEVMWVSRVRRAMVPKKYRDALEERTPYVWALCCQVKDGA